MEKQRKLVFSYLFAFALLTGIKAIRGWSQDDQHHQHHDHHLHHHYHHHHEHDKHSVLSYTKLFVFGDSYADTGNNRKSANSWSEPYGTTFPGKPAGRFSDGRVLTDYLASFVRVKSPIPYRWRKVGKNRIRYGMNFAYGGTGVFDTLVAGPNMTTQIDFLQNLIRDGVYSKPDLLSSIALLSVAGNDYGTYFGHNGDFEGFPAFSMSLVNQIALNLKRIHGLGVRKVAVTALEPMGCLPQSTAASSYLHCNETENTAVNYHNLLLQKAVEKLNNDSKDSAFVILDLNSAFMSAFKSQGGHPGSLKFENPLKPCCVGISEQYYCGNVDENGVKKYVVCDNPESAFFWDAVHPSQQGWLATYSALQISLDQLYS